MKVLETGDIIYGLNRCDIPIEVYTITHTDKEFAYSDKKGCDFYKIWEHAITVKRTQPFIRIHKFYFVGKDQEDVRIHHKFQGYRARMFLSTYDFYHLTDDEAILLKEFIAKMR